MIRDRVLSGCMEALLRRLEATRRVRHVVVGASSLDASWSWTGAAGAAAPDGRRTEAGTPWLIASVTKLYIAAVVLRLVERGLVDLEVSAYQPKGLSEGLHVYRDVDYTGRITATHLLGHLSGLADYLAERPPGRRSLIERVFDDGDLAWTPAEAVVHARDLLRPHFAPSDPRSRNPRIRYSDTNYQLLVVIAEQVTGQPMARLYDELLFEPLGLRHTWLPGRQPPRGSAEPATVWLGDRPLEDRPQALQSFGDLYSTVDDVLRFGRALFNREIFDDPATGDLMWTRFRRFGFPRGLASLRAPGWPIEYGLGVMRFAPSRLLYVGLRVPPLVGHTGSTGSWLWYSRDLSLVTAGTVDQTAAAAVPFRHVPRALAGLLR